MGTDVSKLLDLGGSILDLIGKTSQLFCLGLGQAGTNLIISELQAQLLDTALDSIPASETVTDRDVSGETKVFWLEDLIGRGVVQDGLGVDTSLVGERTITTECIIRSGKVEMQRESNLRDRVHERNVDLDGLSNQVFDFTEHSKVVLALDVFRV